MEHFAALKDPAESRRQAESFDTALTRRGFGLRALEVRATQQFIVHRAIDTELQRPFHASGRGRLATRDRCLGQGVRDRSTQRRPGLRVRLGRSDRDRLISAAKEGWAAARTPGRSGRPCAGLRPYRVSLRTA